MLRRPPGPTLLPCTTLFRSLRLRTSMRWVGLGTVIAAAAVAIVLGLSAADRVERGTGAQGNEPAPAGTKSVSVDRKSTRLNSSHANIPYAVCCLRKDLSVGA